jgi:hypothetical protein
MTKELPITDLTHPAEGKVYLIAAGPGFVCRVYGPLDGAARFTPQGIIDTTDQEEVACLKDGRWTFHGHERAHDSVTVFRQGRRPRYKLCRMTALDDAGWDLGTWQAPGDGWTKQEWLALEETVRSLEDTYFDVLDHSHVAIADPELFTEIGMMVEAGPDAIVQWLYPELERIDSSVMTVSI